MKDIQIFEKIRQRGLNPAKFVYISANDTLDNRKDITPYNLLEPDNGKIYHSKLGINHIIKFDFAISPVSLKALVLTTSQNRDTKNWVFEASNDSIAFTTLITNTETICQIREGTNNIPMCRNYTTKTFELQNPVIYSSFRIRNTGESSEPATPYLIFSAVDFIGHFTDPPHFSYCKKINFPQHFIHIFFFTLFF